jgi:hypothetical protein
MLGLFDLPAPLLIELLAGWLNHFDLLALDSACCSAASRNAYLEAVGSEQVYVEFAPYPEYCHIRCIAWFVSRKAKTKRYSIDANLEDMLDVPNVVKFFHGTGAHLEYLDCDNFVCSPLTTAIFKPTGQVFSRLKALVLFKCGLFMRNINIGQLLRTCRTSLKQRFCFTVIWTISSRSLIYPTWKS